MIYQLFLNCLHATPDNNAVVTSKGEIFTYSMLGTRVNQWANYLMQHNVQPGDRVAVLLDNEDYHYFILLALDKIQATYVPFDTDIPKEQLSIDIARLNLKKFLIEDNLTATFTIPSSLCHSLSPQILMEITEFDATDCHTVKEEQERALYIVSSSGSTGDKKWIPILGAGLGYWNTVIQEVLANSPVKKMLTTRSPAYDARIFEYLCALAFHGTIYLINRKQRKDFPSILEACQANSISSLLLIASQLGGHNTESIVAALKQYGVQHIMVTGDACTLLLKQLCEQYDIELFNCYGPTEATFGLSMLCVNHLRTFDSEDQPIVPMGKPYGDEVKYHLINDKLYIQSPYLTPGYLDGDDNNSFKLIAMSNGEVLRLFDTGDLCSEQRQYIFYQGRYDKIQGHCKINGVKITPHYIEQCIHDYNLTLTESSIQAAVVVKPYLDTNRPVAYVVTSGHFEKSPFLAYLKGRLKKEECPILFKCDELPLLLPSQKINRQALIALEDKASTLFFSEEQVGEQGSPDAFQNILVQIWCELLKCSSVNPDTEFLWLGGTSILEAEMVVAIKERIDTSFSHLDLQELPCITVRSIVDKLINKHAQQSAIQLEPMNQAFIKPLKKAAPSQGTLFFLPALLGEGYYSYRHLACGITENQAYESFSIYGLSDPGTVNSAWLPKDLKHAAVRYVNAIKKIQPDGPYHLLGFSFGSTLVYAVAQEFLRHNETIAELYLVDGFPPHIYQLMSPKEYAESLQTLFNFMIPILNNHYYGEQLKPITLKKFDKLTKQAQIELAFKSIVAKLTHPQSLNVLEVAKCHLTILLTEQAPQEKLPVWPTFYLTDMEEHYQQVMNRQIQLSKESADYHYHFWTRYFNNMTRCGLKLAGDHLNVITEKKRGLSENQRPSFFWRRSHDTLFNLKLDHYGPHAFYRLELLDSAQYRLSVFFASPGFVRYLSTKIRAIVGTPQLLCHDKNYYKYEQNDEIYTSQTNLFCEFPSAKKEDIIQLMEACKLKEEVRKALLKKQHHSELLPKQLIKIDILVMLGRSPLLTLSLSCFTAPECFVRDIYQQLCIVPVELSKEKNTVTYQHRTICTSGVYDAIANVKQFLADFIALIAMHTEHMELLQPVTELGGSLVR